MNKGIDKTQHKDSPCPAFTSSHTDTRFKKLARTRACACMYAHTHTNSSLISHPVRKSTLC